MFRVETGAGEWEGLRRERRGVEQRAALDEGILHHPRSFRI